MNRDTSQCISLPLVEQGMRTLTHEWRNVLNGISLRINAARIEDDSALRETDLAETLALISDASDYLNDLARKLAPPAMTPIAYPAGFFLEDLADYLGKKWASDGPLASWLTWESQPLESKVMIDFNGITRAIAELIGNARRYLPKTSVLTIESHQTDSFLVLSWSEMPPAPVETEAWGDSPFFTTERGHLGLGIYFARRVIVAHSGTLSFTYSPRTKSLLTTISLPLAIL